MNYLEKNLRMIRSKFINQATKKRVLFNFLLLLVFFCSELATAQMFSVKSNKKELIENDSKIEIRLGSSFTNFSYNGENPTDLAAGFFDFNDPVYFIEAQFGGINLHLDYGSELGNNDDLRFVSFSLRFLGGFSLYRSSFLSVELPIQLISDSFTISSQSSLLNFSSRYEQTGFTFGSGLHGNFNLFKTVQVNVTQLAHYGFSARGIGAVYGSKHSFESKLQVISGRVWNDVKLTLNGSYVIQEFDLDDTIYDYKWNGLVVGVGVLF